MAFPRCSVFKDKSRRQKDWRLQCAFGKRGVKTMTHHQCRRLQSLAGNLQYRGFRSPARRGGMGPIVLFICHASLLRSEEHTSELQSLMRISYAVFCLTKKKTTNKNKHNVYSITTAIQNQKKNRVT